MRNRLRNRQMAAFCGLHAAEKVPEPLVLKTAPGRVPGHPPPVSRVTPEIGNRSKIAGADGQAGSRLGFAGEARLIGP